MIDYSKFGFLPYQVRWLEDTSQIKLCEKSRRVGMSYVQAFEDVMDAGVEGKYNVWFSSNNETNAREYVDYCKKFAKVLSLVAEVSGGDKLLDDAEANTFVITFKNGCKITGLSSSPNQLHGKGGKIVLDEFARRDNEFEVWEAASPAALVWGYPIRIISTHRGKLSVFYSFIKRIDRGELSWSKHRTTFPEAVREGLADKSLKKKCTKEEQDAYIAKIRDSVGDPSIWAQQFMCEPQDENETFLSYQLLESAGRAELLPFEELSHCKELYGGLDVGRVKNFTLLWLIEKVSYDLYITRFILPIQGEEFPKQDRKLSGIITALPNLRRLCIDKSGVGWGLTEYLQEKHGTAMIEGVLFTGQSKEVMAFRLKKTLSDLSFFIPGEQKIYTDFQLVKQSTTASGNVRLQAGTKEDSHADYFWSAALALEAASEGGYVPPAVHTIQERRSERLDKILSGFSKD